MAQHSLRVADDSAYFSDEPDLEVGPQGTIAPVGASVGKSFLFEGASIAPKLATLVVVRNGYSGTLSVYGVGFAAPGDGPLQVGLIANRKYRITPTNTLVTVPEGGACTPNSMPYGQYNLTVTCVPPMFSWSVGCSFAQGQRVSHLSAVYTALSDNVASASTAPHATPALWSRELPYASCDNQPAGSLCYDERTVGSYKIFYGGVCGPNGCTGPALNAEAQAFVNGAIQMAGTPPAYTVTLNLAENVVSARFTALGRDFQIDHAVFGQGNEVVQLFFEDGIDHDRIYVAYASQSPDPAQSTQWECPELINQYFPGVTLEQRQQLIGSVTAIVNDENYRKSFATLLAASPDEGYKVEVECQYIRGCWQRPHRVRSVSCIFHGRQSDRRLAARRMGSLRYLRRSSEILLE
jgi:hypothetical protein